MWAKKSKNLTRKLKITLTNKKRKAQTTQKKYGQEIQPVIHRMGKYKEQ